MVQCSLNTRYYLINTKKIDVNVRPRERLLRKIPQYIIMYSSRLFFSEERIAAIIRKIIPVYYSIIMKSKLTANYNNLKTEFDVPR